ncbi:MAG: hypothetical protein GY853_15300 [PVC group bacterium]|nr:hypothetical protein [PVC group bacterium]
MTYKSTKQSTTADPTNINTDFYHIGQGSRLPMGGNSLTSTDSVYDLGSSTATWNNLHCDNIYVGDSISSTNKSLWVLLAETTLDDSSSSINFAGLNGDAYTDMMIFAMIKSAVVAGDSICRLFLNEDSSASYGHQYIHAADTSVLANRNVLQGIEIANAKGAIDKVTLAFGKALLYTKTGNERIAMAFYCGGAYENHVYQIDHFHSIWTNTSSTLTSMQFNAITNNFDVGSHIELWVRQ